MCYCNERTLGLKMKDLLSILDNFSLKRIAIVGDMMLDHYLEGKSTRTSPEAPIPIISVEKEWFAPGGAGNTAINIAQLGAKPTLFGRLGNGAEADILLKKLMQGGVRVDALPGVARTITKNRIMVDRKHFTRFDCEFEGSTDYISEFLEKSSLQNFYTFTFDGDYSAVLISDYAKGFITENIAKEVLRIAKEQNKIVIVDTKPKHFWWYKGVFCIKPNKSEAEEFSKIQIESLEDAERAGKYIKKVLGSNVLLTLGPMGMILFEEERTTHFSSSAKEVFDVTGAGDTVLATFGLGLASGASMRQAADLANHAAALVIAKSGTTSVSLEELKKSLT